MTFRHVELPNHHGDAAEVSGKTLLSSSLRFRKSLWIAIGIHLANFVHPLLYGTALLPANSTCECSLIVRIATLLVTILVPIAATYLDLVPYPASRAATAEAVRSHATWVRTVNGWEQSNCWKQDFREPPRLNPFVVAAFQICASLLALLAFPANHVASASHQSSLSHSTLTAALR